MEKINIAELLKDCPKGMELYSPIFGEVYLDKIRPHLAIVVTIDKDQGNFKEEFLYDGRYGMNGECMLFPSKDKTTWEGFQRPFKDGDVVVDSNGAIFLYRRIHPYYEEQYADFYCGLTSVFRSFIIKTGEAQRCGKINSIRLAIEEEKQKLFDAIKANGYKWNAETKTLEKLPKFKVGDKVRYKGDKTIITITAVNDGYYFIQYYNSRKNDYQNEQISFKDQDKYKLITNKFDITILKPSDKVLVRDNNEQKWTLDFFSFTDKELVYPFVCVGHYVTQCIPYKGNEHLLGTTGDCDDYYKIWK